MSTTDDGVVPYPCKALSARLFQTDDGETAEGAARRARQRMQIVLARRPELDPLKREIRPQADRMHQGSRAHFDGTQQRVAGAKMIEQEQSAARLEHPPSFIKHRLGIGHQRDKELSDNGIETRVVEFKRECVHHGKRANCGTRF